MDTAAMADLMEAMAVMEATDTAAMADLMEAMVVMADPMEDMEAMAMARGRLRLPLMLSLAMEAMDTAAMADLMEAMAVMADPTEDMEDMAMESKSNFLKPAFMF